MVCLQGFNRSAGRTNTTVRLERFVITQQVVTAGEPEAVPVCFHEICGPGTLN